MTTTYRLDEDTIEEAGAVEQMQIVARSELHKLNTLSVGKLLTFDRARGAAEVELSVKRYVVGEEGRTYYPVTLLAALVAAPGGAGQALTSPLEPGDLVVVGFSREALDAWVEQGAHNGEPRSPELFGAMHAIIMGRVQPFGAPLAWEEGVTWLGDDPYQGGPVEAGDARVGLRVERGERAELARIQTGQPTRRVAVTKAGKVIIGDEEGAELIGLLRRLVLGLPLMVTSGPNLGPPPSDPTLFTDAAAILAALDSGA